jgi:transcriptional regulator with XRE-family HTH domain
MAYSIGGRIKALRKAKGWTQEALSEKMNVAQSLVAKVEGGARNLTVDEAIRLAELFETSTDYILRGIKPDFVNVSTDLGLDADAIDNLRNVRGTPGAKGKEGSGCLDNLDVANFLMSYDGWPIVDTLRDYFNTPEEAAIAVPMNAPKDGDIPHWLSVNKRSIILARLQDVLSQMYDRVKRGEG